MVLGDDVSTLETFVWILNGFKVYNLVSIRPKSMKLGQMINLNMMGSVYRLVTIRNSPQFPVEFRNGLYVSVKFNLRSNGRETCLPFNTFHPTNSK